MCAYLFTLFKHYKAFCMFISVSSTLHLCVISVNCSATFLFQFLKKLSPSRSAVYLREIHIHTYVCISMYILRINTVHHLIYLSDRTAIITLLHICARAACSCLAAAMHLLHINFLSCFLPWNFHLSFGIEWNVAYWKNIYTHSYLFMIYICNYVQLLKLVMTRLQILQYFCAAKNGSIVLFTI